jgi:urease accessory protein
VDELIAQSTQDLRPSDAAAAGDWLLWQLVDSAFPTGGFAHSGGVEAIWQHGLLRDGDDLRSIVAAGLRQTAHSAAPVALAVTREPSSFDAWNAFYDVTVTNHVANRASRAQGRALLSTAAEVFRLPLIVGAYERVRREKLTCHLPAAFGLAGAALGVPEAAVARAFLFMTARGLVSSAVRLGAIGPLEGQRVQASAGSDVEACVRLAQGQPPKSIAQTAFMADLLQSTQDRLYSRLFQS